MNTPLTIPVIVIPALLLTGCIEIDHSPMAQYRAPFHYSYDVQPGAKVTVEDTNGMVEISGWEQNKVELDGEKTASSQKVLDNIRIDVRNENGSIRIRAVTESGAHLFSNSGASFRLHVPHSAQLSGIDTTNGRIEVHDIDGGANLHTTNGRISGSAIRGEVSAHTSNGAIDVHGIDGFGSFETTNGAISIEFAKAPAGAVHARSSNGAITLRLPPDTSAHLSVSSSNSRISNDFELSGSVRNDKRDVSGDIGKGGPSIELSTSNGPIRILRE